MENIVDDIKKMVDNTKDNPEELAVELAKLFENQTKGLETNKNSILLEKKELAEKIKKLQGTIDNIDISEYNALKSEKEKGLLVEQGNSSDLADLKMELNKLQTENNLINTRLTEVSESKAEIENRLKSDKISLALTEGYTTAGVKKEFIPILVKANRDIAQTQQDENGGLNVLMGTSDGGLVPIDNFFDTWKNSDTAKSFIQAPINQGAGANGSGNANSGKSKKDMTLDERTAYAKKHGQEAYNRLT